MSRNILTTSLLVACLFVVSGAAFATPFHGWNDQKPLLPPANVGFEPGGVLFETCIPPKPSFPGLDFLEFRFGIPSHRSGVFDYNTVMVDDIPGGPGRRGHGGWYSAFWSPATNIDMICCINCTDLFKKTV